MGLVVFRSWLAWYYNNHMVYSDYWYSDSWHFRCSAIPLLDRQAIFRGNEAWHGKDRRYHGELPTKPRRSELVSSLTMDIKQGCFSRLASAHRYTADHDSDQGHSRHYRRRRHWRIDARSWTEEERHLVRGV